MEQTPDMTSEPDVTDMSMPEAPAMEATMQMTPGDSDMTSGPDSMKDGYMMSEHPMGDDDRGDMGGE